MSVLGAPDTSRTSANCPHGQDQTVVDRSIPCLFAGYADIPCLGALLHGKGIETGGFRV